jgi:hypothetical protein
MIMSQEKQRKTFGMYSMVKGPTGRNSRGHCAIESKTKRRNFRAGVFYRKAGDFGENGGGDYWF